MRMLWLIYAVTCYVAHSAGTPSSSSDEQAPTYGDHDLEPFESFSRTFVQATFGNKDIFGGCSPLSAAFDKMIFARKPMSRRKRTEYFDLMLEELNIPELANRYCKLPGDYQSKMVMKQQIFCSKTRGIPSDISRVAKSRDWQPVIVDFTDTDATLYTINKWAEITLNHPAERFLQPDNIPKALDFFAMSVVSFESEWDYGVKSSPTKMRPFYIGSGPNPTLVKTMIKSGWFETEFIDDLDATFVNLPFKNQEANMYIFFPKDKNNIHLMTKNLKKINIDRLRDAEYRHVHIELPFFKVDKVIDVGMTLREMKHEKSVDDYFVDEESVDEESTDEESADEESTDEESVDEDSGNKTSVDGKSVDKNSLREEIEIFQKIYIEITDKGSGFKTAKNPLTVDDNYLDNEVTNETISLVVNHAFLFQIVTEEGQIIFTGRINKPSHVDYNDRYAQPISAMLQPNKKENDV